MPLSVSPRRHRRGPLALAVVALAVLVIPGAVLAAKPAPPPPVTIQLLNVSDWHGNVDPVGGIGGAWNIAARWQEDRLVRPTLTLTAGDDFGASPALVGFFNEEPSVLAQRLMGIQVGTFGNHNWDKNNAHLQSMIDLAGAPTDANHPGNPFRYVAANLKNLSANLTGVAPVAYFNVAGVKVAVIGIVNEEAPTLVFPGAFGTIQITDGVAAANKFAGIARKAGANVVVVMTHKGVRGLSPATGELIDFTEGLDPSLVDVVLGDHTDIQYSGTINGILVHENRSFGVTYAKTIITAQPGKGGRVSAKGVEFVSPTAGTLGSNNNSCTGGTSTYCDQAVLDMLAPYRAQLAALLDGKVGTTTEPYKARPGNIERRQEVPLGNLVADSMRWRYSTDLALISGGGLRSNMPACSYLPLDTSLNRAAWNGTYTTISTCPGYGSGTPYDVVLGDIFTVLPFANNLNTRSVSGAQIWEAMENGVSRILADGSSTDGRFPQISGFKFGFRYDIPTGCVGNAESGVWTDCPINRVQWVELSDGTPILNDNSQSFTITLPNFTNQGGDNYIMFADGQGATQELDALVLAAYVDHLGGVLDPLSDPLGRITKCATSTCPAP